MKRRKEVSPPRRPAALSDPCCCGGRAPPPVGHGEGRGPKRGHSESDCCLRELPREQRCVSAIRVSRIWHLRPTQCRSQQGGQVFANRLGELCSSHEQSKNAFRQNEGLDRSVLCSRRRAAPPQPPPCAGLGGGTRPLSARNRSTSNLEVIHEVSLFISIICVPNRFRLNCDIVLDRMPLTLLRREE